MSTAKAKSHADEPDDRQYIGLSELAAELDEDADQIASWLIQPPPVDQDPADS